MHAGSMQRRAERVASASACVAVAWALLQRQCRMSVVVQEARKLLGQFGLDGDQHLLKIGSLSGGQKAR